ncbi:thermonuclease family protein [Bartonella sp. A05]|uniref:thermonuclease family protein n=1 Tax=Bartonella sp. A05 TaxID=2967261 RepID=UPI0022A9D656|nr:thermonuclease family protein [Bartonella sp. A05]MCZ2204231.1 thermonuclease family protein [Bartonella sp. A05]
MKRKNFLSNLGNFKQKAISLSILTASILFIDVAIHFKHIQTQPHKIMPVSRGIIKGNASIIDGDSIAILSIMIRLAGIDAPELHQFCGIKKRSYPCGLKAKEYLEKLIANQPVTCYWNKKDKYDRILATCRTDQISNINATIVHNGWAVSYYSYRKEEKEAKEQKKGIWQSPFQMPQEWRKANPYIK